MQEAGTIENGISVETKYGMLDGCFMPGAYSGRRIVWAAPEQYVREGGGLFTVYVPAGGRRGPVRRASSGGNGLSLHPSTEVPERERCRHIALDFAESKVRWLEKRYPEWKRQVSFLERTGTVPGKLLPYRGRLITVGYHEERFVKLYGFEDVPVGNDAPSDFSAVSGAVLCLPSPAARQVPRVLIGGREIKLRRYEGAERERMENGDMIRAWYASRALRICETKTRAFARQMGVGVQKVGLTWANSLWGKNRLDVRGGRKNGSYESLEIVYHPLSTAFSDYELDALIWHELAHCREANHQKAFYGELLRWLPDYRERDRALKDSAWVKSVPVPGT